MPDYNQSDVTGTKWTRAVKVNIINSLDQTPVLFMEEEEVVNFGDDKVFKPSGVLRCDFDAANPLHVELYDRLNALYVILREERDARLVEVSTKSI